MYTLAKHCMKCVLFINHLVTDTLVILFITGICTSRSFLLIVTYCSHSRFVLLRHYTQATGCLSLEGLPFPLWGLCRKRR
ncbi:hypothetical protein FKM82_028644 [Ascaphus truei]